MTYTEKVTKRESRIFWMLTVSYMGLIFFLSSLHGFSLPELPKNSDKFIHTVAYMPLGFLFYMSLIKSGFGRYVFAFAMLLTVLYGVTDEFHQSFVPGRYATIGDVVADSIGALLGCLGASFIKKR